MKEIACFCSVFMIFNHGYVLHYESSNPIKASSPRHVPWKINHPLLSYQANYIDMISHKSLQCPLVIVPVSSVEGPYGPQKSLSWPLGWPGLMTLSHCDYCHELSCHVAHKTAWPLILCSKGLKIRTHICPSALIEMFSVQSVTDWGWLCVAETVCLLQSEVVMKYRCCQSIQESRG